jgi:hypothetical protein
VQEQKDLRDVVLEQIENTMLESDKERFVSEGVQSSGCCGDTGAGGGNDHHLLHQREPLPGRRQTPCWDKIVHKQTKKDPWTNLRGEEQSGIHGKMMAAWNDCYILMKTVFANNMAEQQKFYLTFLHLSPSKQKVRAFLQCFTTLAGYVAKHPSLIHSHDATDATKQAVEPYGDGKLQRLHCKRCLTAGSWRTQYDLGHKAWTLQEQCKGGQNVFYDDWQDPQEKISRCEA